MPRGFIIGQHQGAAGYYNSPCPQTIYMELDEIQKKVGKAMRKAREDAKLSLAQLAKSSGLRKAHLSNCELGKKNATLDTIRRFGNGCNLVANVSFDKPA